IRWQESVRRGATGALAHAHTLLPLQRDQAIAAFEASFATSRAIADAQAATSSASLGSDHADARLAAAEAEDEERQYRALGAALSGASLELASLAYVVVG
nr:hypothetical protein [Planctomycetota bacterium]